MKKLGIRILSILLALSVLCGFPISAAAEDYALTAQYDGYDVTLSWSSIFGADKYNVYRSCDGANYQLIDYTYSTDYYDWDTSDKCVYYYYVSAVREDEVEHSYDYWSYTDYVDTEFFSFSAVSVVTFNPQTASPEIDRYSDKAGITIDWYLRNSTADGVYIYRSVNAGTYSIVADLPVSTCSWTDSSAKAYSNYRYVVASYANINGVIYCSPDFTKSTEAVNTIKNVTLTTKTKSEVVKWKKITGASKYVIYQATGWNTDKAISIASVSSGKTSATIKNVNNLKKSYTYYICAYNSSGQLIGQSANYYSDDSYARFRAAVKKKKNKNTVPVVNVRTKKTTKAWSSSISKKDKKILDKFAKKHFKKGWSDAQKAEYTLKWINKNVKYANGSDYNKIANCSYVEAIFSKKLGQCLQYNGAYAMFLTYLGYDARIVQGWRGSSMKKHWSHYWCEINIDGKWMLMETGNYQTDGYWMYFCTPYKNTSGYLINQKPAK